MVLSSYWWVQSDDGSELRYNISRNASCRVVLIKNVLMLFVNSIKLLQVIYGKEVERNILVPLKVQNAKNYS